MTRDRSTIWIGISDLLLCVVCVVIVAVNPPKPVHAGVDEKAEYLLTVEWSTEPDADVDIWLQTPRKMPVFFNSRQVGCATLDQDNKGWGDSIIHLPDGSTTKVRAVKETIALRCIEPGHYDLAVNLFGFSNHEGAPGLPLPAHVEITGLNPEVKTLFSKDISLTYQKQTINVASFDLSPNGDMTFVDPPLKPVSTK
jgi:hypothetical protein